MIKQYEKWDEDNPPTVPFNLIVDLTMHGDCHSQADRELSSSLMEVVRHVRHETWLAATKAERDAVWDAAINFVGEFADAQHRFGDIRANSDALNIASELRAIRAGGE